jgi:hypothetical protein
MRKRYLRCIAPLHTCYGSKKEMCVSTGAVQGPDRDVTGMLK